MSSKLFRTSLLASTVIAGTLMGVAPAMAQTTPGVGATPAAPVIGGSSTSAEPVNPNGTDASGNAAAAEQGIITVTGSRIANPNLTSTSPLTVVSGQEVKLQGNTRVEDLLNSLPQVTASQGSTDANGATGIATVDLRALGSTRTLVLINGRRLVPGDVQTPVADLNFIPSSLIQRVEVLTGGASSTYGSDAVAGVVNFIMNKDFEGVRLDAQYSFYQHNNDTIGSVRAAQAAFGIGQQVPQGSTVGGQTENITLTIGTGTADGRGHVTAYAGWRQVAAVTQAERDFSYCGLAATGAGYICSGSGTVANGRFRRTQVANPASVLLGAAPTYSPVAGALGAQYTLNAAVPNTFRTYNAAADVYNFNPTNYFQRPDERYTLGAFAHYEVSPAFDPYMEAMFMDDHTRAQIAPSGAFYGTDFFINCNNPLLSAQEAGLLCPGVARVAGAQGGAVQSVYIGKRNVEGGGRVDDFRHTDYRVVIGARGEIAKGVTYDGYLQMGRAIYAERYENDFSRRRLNNSLNVVNNAAGQPVCASALPNAQGQVTDPLCVPYNIFALGGVSQAALNYLQIPTFRQGATTEYVASASVTAELGEYGIQSPYADDGIGINFGGEYRNERLRLNGDVATLTGDRAGAGSPFGTPDARGGVEVRELFTEIQVPIIQHNFIESLSLNAGYRYSSYNISGSTDTYKVGLELAPTKDIRFRGSYNRAVRAPNILNLLSPQNVGLFSGTDGCAGAAPTFTFAQCARTGVTAAQYGLIDPNPANQYNQRTSGNTALTPEVADTYTLGAVITPTFLPGFALSLDAYQIKIKKLISTLGAQFTLNQCALTGSPFFCSNIQRAVGSGSLFTGASFVANGLQNLGAVNTSGIDVNASYRLELTRFGLNNAGSLGFDLAGSYLRKYKITNVTGPGTSLSYECESYFGLTCATPLPQWRHKLRVTYNTPWNVQVSGAWRYFSRVKNDLISPNGNIGGNTVAAVGTAAAQIKSQSYFDLSLTARVTDKYTFRTGVQNLFDRTPPIVASANGYAAGSNGSNTFAQVYDSLGRYIYAGVTIDF